MTPEIITKLNKFLDTHDPFREECEVVYLMVEIRKLLYRERDERQINRFRLIHFYANWTVHIDIDRNTTIIEDIINKISYEIDTNGHPKHGNLDFLSMSELQEEIQSLLEEYNLPSMLCTEQRNWERFVDIFVEVLADQPIKIANPASPISSFSFLPGTKARTASIEFNDERGNVTIGIAR